MPTQSRVESREQTRVQTEQTDTALAVDPNAVDAPPADEQSALKPLIYILVIPFALIALLQWSGLPAVLVKAVGGP